MQDSNYLSRFAREYLKPHWIQGLEAWICMIVNVVFGLSLPLITVFIIDNIIVNGNISFLNVISIALILLLPVSTLFEFLERILLAGLKERVLFEVQSDLFEHIQNLPLAYFQKNQGGYIFSRITNDLDSLEGALADGFLEILNSMITLLIIIGIMFYMHWKLALITLAIVPLYITNFLKFGRVVQQKEVDILEHSALLNGFVQESISGVRTIRAFQREHFVIKRFIHQVKHLIRKIMGKEVTVSVAGGINQTLTFLGPLLVLWYGGTEIINENLTLGQFIAFNTYVAQLFDPIHRVMGINLSIQVSIGAIKRIYELLDLKPDFCNKKNAYDLPYIKSEIIFKKVNFSYDSQNLVLKSINLKIKAGQKVAFVGVSGSGKTTLVNLLMRFHEPESGNITFDGMDLRNVTHKSLRNQIAFVEQENFLFHGTIKDNIRFGRLRASQQEIEEAAKKAFAHDFIKKMPDGYNTVVGDRGQGLSGGQKQRISLARAFLKNPAILILDEATSALDNQSEKIIQDILFTSWEGRTIIIVAHRLSTIMSVDRIFVMKAGTILQEGTFSELTTEEGPFKALYNSQLESNSINAAYSEEYC